MSPYPACDWCGETPNCPDHARDSELAYGTRVRYGFTTGEVIAAERRNGQDGYRVQDAYPPGDYGALRPYPRWVPASAVSRA